ncbi:MAG: 50S ribosomal protein L6 [Rickettsiales bacterium]|jgi:large subunit ribosomal protein L6|nr:50S ribosomal protein L6 [Rickettsiales bacterium]
MSRAGKNKIEIPNGVTVAKEGGAIVVRGPKGELSVRVDTANSNLVKVDIDEKSVLVSPFNPDDKASRAMWGTMARNIKQAVTGVTMGYFIEMGMKGVGFKAVVKGKDLVLTAGYSHDVVMPIPNGISVEVSSATEFKISGTDKNAVGIFADKIRKVRKPEPYKGKGIFYKNETIRRKEGKKK